MQLCQSKCNRYSHIWEKLENVAVFLCWFNGKISVYTWNSPKNRRSLSEVTFTCFFARVNATPDLFVFWGLYLGDWIVKGGEGVWGNMASIAGLRMPRGFCGISSHQRAVLRYSTVHLTFLVYSLNRECRQGSSSIRTAFPVIPPV